MNKKEIIDLVTSQRNTIPWHSDCDFRSLKSFAKTTLSLMETE